VGCNSILSWWELGQTDVMWPHGGSSAKTVGCNSDSHGGSWARLMRCSPMEGVVPKQWDVIVTRGSA
jgi:hypothetical protein